jgi:hypothetical protein
MFEEEAGNSLVFRHLRSSKSVAMLLQRFSLLATELFVQSFLMLFLYSCSTEEQPDMEIPDLCRLKSSAPVGKSLIMGTSTRRQSGWSRWCKYM